MKITIEISDISRVIELANTHGTLSCETLARMLMMRRPGCWEAANMAQVLASHGYEITARLCGVCAWSLEIEC